MAKTKISEWSTTPASNTDIDGINIAEGCAPSGINDAIRDLMAQVRSWQSGASGDPFNGPMNGTIGATTAYSGAFTTVSATGVITSTLATGTAPLTIASTTKVANLNVDLLDGADWASPAALGSTTPAAVSATTLSASGAVTLSGGTANGVTYLNGSKQLVSGSALTFDGSNLSTSLSGSTSLSMTSSASQAFINLRSVATAGYEPFIGFGDASAGNIAQMIGIVGGGVRWTTGGSEQMRLTSTGLGIGTSSPTGYLANKLVIDTSTDSNNGITIASASNRNGSIWFADGKTGNQAYRGGIDYQHTTDTLYLYSGAQGNFILDSAGNLGLGVTPNTWYSGTKALEIGATTALMDISGQTNLYQNGYLNAAGNVIYKTTNYATQYRSISGQHQWFTAASGTAGNAISFTQAMTLDASGNLGVGTTSIVNNIGGGTTMNLGGLTTTEMVIQGTYQYINNAPFQLTFKNLYTGGSVLGSISAYLQGAVNSGALIFSTASGGTNAERARIDSSGNLLVGTTSGSDKIVVDQSAAASASQFKNSSGTATAQCVVAWHANTTGDNVFHQFFTEASATSRGSITYNRTAGLVAYNTTSDYRAKDIIGPVTDSGALIDSTPVYMGKMKGATQERPMFIAHETPAYAHTGQKDAVDADGNPVYQQMDASALIPVMWAEIQSLRQRVAQLETN